MRLALVPSRKRKRASVTPAADLGESRWAGPWNGVGLDLRPESIHHPARQPRTITGFRIRMRPCASASLTAA